MLRTTLVLAACLLAAACSTHPTEPQIVDGWEVFGAGVVSSSAPMSIDAVLADPESHDGEQLVLEGTIDECCQTKGCWMTFTDGEESLRVKFLDYGFFVPLDSAGRSARMEGTFMVREIPLEEAQHYLEDAGKHDEAAALSGPQHGYEFIASGVQLQLDDTDA